MFRLSGFLFISLFSAVAFGQSTDATISGLVIDPSGAGIQGAQVTVRNTRTGVVNVTDANTTGSYVFAALQPGNYQLSASHSGFSKYVVNELELDVGANCHFRTACHGASSGWTKRYGSAEDVSWRDWSQRWTEFQLTISAVPLFVWNPKYATTSRLCANRLGSSIVSTNVNAIRIPHPVHRLH